MKPLILFFLGLIGFYANIFDAYTVNLDHYSERGINRDSTDTDNLPTVFNDRANLLDIRYREEAAFWYTIHQLPGSTREWELKKARIQEAIVKGAAVESINPELPFHVEETSSISMNEYSIKNIAFQTLPGVYATANLFVPDGEGPFPAVLIMMGHWESGKLAGQEIGHTLALNGYVGLVIDPWGAGERTTNAGEFEYHGGNLGASLMNVGRSLLGIQISDNIRAVDLLSSLPYVDPEKIGATGASGGGNQTMWLTAMDDRIKAAVPVVSVGTFDSYVLGHNCICEVLIDGLTHTETSGVLALIAPRALKMHNHTKESNPAFFPEEMLRSYKHAKQVYELYGAEEMISYDLFDLPHGYFRENREGMLGWFDLHLKGIGNGNPKKEIPFDRVSEEKLLVYPEKRYAGVKSTAEYNILEGKKLKDNLLNNLEFNPEKKQNELKDILRIYEDPKLDEVYQYTSVSGWDRFALKGTDDKLIPLLLRAPRNQSEEYVVIIHPDGKDAIPFELLEDWISNDTGIILTDLSGTGENALSKSVAHHEIAGFHTLSRSNLWLGKTLLGEWVQDLNIVIDFLISSQQASDIHIDGTRDTGLAALFFAALNENKINSILNRETPVSYLFDTRESINFFTMAIHLPGILKWGDVSLAAGLSGIDVTFFQPVTSSGRPISGNVLKKTKVEFEKMRRALGKPGQTEFIE